MGGAKGCFCLSTRIVAAAQVGSSSSSRIFLFSLDRVMDSTGAERLTAGCDDFGLATLAEVEGTSSRPLSKQEEDHNEIDITSLASLHTCKFITLFPLRALIHTNLI